MSEHTLPEKDQALYNALSLVANYFYPPEHELVESLQALPEVAGLLDPEMADAAGRMLAAFQEQSLDELLKEYSRLFIGPFQLEAPPFGSIYLESEGRLMGQSTAEVKRIYQECGLDISPDFQSPPDHVAAELEFVAYLGWQEKGSQDEEQKRFYQEQRTLFLHRHIGYWFPLLADNIEKHTILAFYLELSRLTRQLLELAQAQAGLEAKCTANDELG
ncbi:MAG: molecular chaperone TorD family protein [Desulfovermiculus sp.]|nr:molecular chaperone TorD family protein [Desulfovermiculus sp.]